jgi:hypothetical protein
VTYLHLALDASVGSCGPVPQNAKPIHPLFPEPPYFPSKMPPSPESNILNRILQVKPLSNIVKDSYS